MMMCKSRDTEVKKSKRVSNTMGMRKSGVLFTDWLCTGTVIGKLLRQLMLKVREGDIRLQLQRFLQFVQSLAAENWKERRPKEVSVLGMTSAFINAGARATSGCCYGDQ
jgi:hypothetical protein